MTRLTRRTWLGVCFAQAGCIPHLQPAIAKGARWLWNMQARDGGWHSETYGLLRSGQSLTPFVLDALLDVPQCIDKSRLERGIAFLHSHTGEDGALGLAEDIPDYPNYATALAVRVLVRARRPGLAGRMAAYLRAQQFTEQNGWRPADPAYGGWGMGGTQRTPPDTGHVDLSMTRHVLEALSASGAPQGRNLFVERCQNPDGGFCFTTTEFDTNKAGHNGVRFRSYGTATADGILALAAAGRSSAPACQWLTAHHTGFEASGFEGEAYHRWPRGLAFYYAAVAAKAFRSLGLPPPAGVVEELHQTQHAAGYWSNPENLVKEDDPLIATAFALRALAAA
jgi:hypothetical protein